MGRLLDLLLWFIVPILGIAFVFSLRWIMHLHRILATPVVPIGLLSPNKTGAVIGRATQDPLQSPLTHTACAFWEVKVVAILPRTIVVPILKQSSQDPIHMNDGTGELQAWPEDAELILHEDMYFSMHQADGIPEDVLMKLQEMGASALKLQTLKFALRIHERYIQSDDTVYALGLVVQEGKQRSLRSNKKHPLLLADYTRPNLIRRLWLYIGLILFLLLLFFGPFIWFIWLLL